MAGVKVVVRGGLAARSRVFIKNGAAGTLVLGILDAILRRTAHHFIEEHSPAADTHLRARQLGLRFAWDLLQLGIETQPDFAETGNRGGQQSDAKAPPAEFV